MQFIPMKTVKALLSVCLVLATYGYNALADGEVNLNYKGLPQAQIDELATYIGIRPGVPMNFSGEDCSVRIKYDGHRLEFWAEDSNLTKIPGYIDAYVSLMEELYEPNLALDKLVTSNTSLWASDIEAGGSDEEQSFQLGTVTSNNGFNSQEFKSIAVSKRNGKIYSISVTSLSNTLAMGVTPNNDSVICQQFN